MMQPNETMPIALSPGGGRYRFADVARAEFLKVTTLRSTTISLVLTVVASLVVTVLASRSAGNHGPGGTSFQGFDATQQALSGVIVAALTGGVFGALLVTSEYSSGTMRATLAASPGRPLLLVAKLVVTGVAMVVFCEALSFATFFVGQAVLSGAGAPSVGLGAPGALRAVTMSGLFIALIALMSFGFGLVFRSTAAAIAAFVGVVFVLPLVVHGISEPAMRYLPTNILTTSIMSTVSQGPQGGPVQPLAPAVGLLLMVVYTAAVVAVGAVLFVRRDA
jgi:ABC-2 type transport system permease protein